MKRNVSAMVEKMPDEHFAYKPVPEVRSFGESVAHVADAQARNCNLVSGAGSRRRSTPTRKRRSRSSWRRWVNRSQSAMPRSRR